MPRRLLTLAVLALVAVFAIAACNSGEASSGAPGAYTVNADEAVEMMMVEGFQEEAEAEVALRKEKSVLEEQRKEMALEIQRRVDAERQRIEETTADAFRLREAEWRKKIDDAQRANEDLKRKLEQGSQQLQGEVLELELEALLGTAFPFDGIEPVRKGARGADVIQTVRLRSGVNCGRIIWETKRAENWSNAWIGKLKDDQQTAGGELAVPLVQLADDLFRRMLLALHRESSLPNSGD